MRLRDHLVETRADRQLQRVPSEKTGEQQTENQDDRPEVEYETLGPHPAVGIELARITGHGQVVGQVFTCDSDHCVLCWVDASFPARSRPAGCGIGMRKTPLIPVTTTVSGSFAGALPVSAIGRSILSTAKLSPSSSLASMSPSAVTNSSLPSTVVAACVSAVVTPVLSRCQFSPPSRERYAVPRRPWAMTPLRVATRPK